jgi:predicted amidohydrolase
VKDIVISLWTYPTLDKASMLKTIDERLAALEKAVEACAKTVTTLGADIELANEFHAIFAAPEYYFTAPAATRTALTATQKDLLYIKLAALSKKYPKILMLPGSIFFKEEIDTEVARTKMKSHLLMSEITAKSTLAKPDYEDVLSGWTTSSGVRVPALKDIATELGRDAPTGERVRNVAYVLLGGERQAMYDKHVDFTESIGASPDNLFFIPGTQDQCPVIGNFKFGVEICFDHASAVLSRRNVSKLDFHIVLSAWTSNSETNMAMAKGGFFLHASSNPQATAAYTHNVHGKIVELVPSPTTKKENTLLQYRVEIDKRPLVTVAEAPKLTVPKADSVTVKGVKLPPGAIKLPMPPGKTTTQ